MMAYTYGVYVRRKNRSLLKKIRFSPSSFLGTNDKNPVHVSGRDFYFLLLTSSLLPQPKFLTGFLGSNK